MKDKSRSKGQHIKEKIKVKIDRIIGIINFIQENGKTTMPYLAERFNVSRRTVCRDIDIICGCGIPIVTSQGVDGGIELKRAFTLTQTLFLQKSCTKFFRDAGS